jgi:hypothetical protein
MIRITRFSTPRTLEPAEGRQALEAAQQAAEAAKKVSGVRWVKVCLSSGELVFVGENDNYAAADAILGDAGVQAAFARLGQTYGYRPAGDEFLTDVEQILPFLKG